MSENTQVSPRPKIKGDYLCHQFVCGLSVHAFDPLLSEHFVRYFISFPNGNTHTIDKLGGVAFHNYHISELQEIIKTELKHNRK
jgi:hypothetical protein